jgi:hypothetical protein
MPPLRIRLKKTEGSGATAPRSQSRPTTKAQTNIMEQEPEPEQGVVNSLVGVVSAEQLTGPWIVALIKGVSVPLTIYTFCPKNLIPFKLVEQFGREMTPTSGNLMGLAGAPLGVLGKTVLSV